MTYIVWVSDGHTYTRNPVGTLKEAVEFETYGSTKIITPGEVEYKVEEVDHNNTNL